MTLDQSIKIGGLKYLEVQPQAIKEEELILGAIISSNWEGINEVLDYALSRDQPLSVEDFHLSIHQHWYKAILSLHEQNEPINLATIGRFADELHPRAQIINFVDSLQIRILGNGNQGTIQSLIDLVQEKRQRRDLIAHYHKQSGYIFDVFTPTDEAIALYQKSADFGGDQPSENAELVAIGESLIETFANLEKKMSGEIEPKLRTGWIDFDERFSGIPHGITVVAGRPAMGKSAAALTVGLNNALKGKSVLLFSLEMNRDQINNRLIAMVSGIDSRRLDDGKLIEGETDKVIAAIEVLSPLKIFIMDKPTDVFELSKRVVKWARQHGKPPDLVIVDYLQLLIDDSSHETPYQQVSKISRQLLKLSKFLQIRPSEKITHSFPLIAVCQLSRKVEERNNKRPVMSDIKESGQIEQDADKIIGFYRDEYYNPDTTLDIGAAEAIVLKNRNGGTGTVKLMFQAETTRFYSMPVENNYGAF